APGRLGQAADRDVRSERLPPAERRAASGVELRRDDRRRQVGLLGWKYHCERLATSNLDARGRVRGHQEGGGGCCCEVIAEGPCLMDEVPCTPPVLGWP